MFGKKKNGKKEARTYLLRPEAQALIDKGRLEIAPLYIEGMGAFLNETGFFKMVRIEGHPALVFTHEAANYAPAQENRDKIALVQLWPEGKWPTSREMMREMGRFSQDMQRVLSLDYSLIGTDTARRVFRSSFLALRLIEDARGLALRLWHSPARPNDWTNPDGVTARFLPYEDVATHEEKSEATRDMLRRFRIAIKKIALGKHPVSATRLKYRPRLQRFVAKTQVLTRLLADRSTGPMRTTRRLYEYAIALRDVFDIFSIPATVQKGWELASTFQTAREQHHLHRLADRVSAARFTGSLAPLSRSLKADAAIDFAPPEAGRYPHAGVARIHDVRQNAVAQMALALLPRLGLAYDFVLNDMHPSPTPVERVFAVRRISPDGMSSITFFDRDEVWIVPATQVLDKGARLVPEMEGFFADDKVYVFHPRRGELLRTMELKEASDCFAVSAAGMRLRHGLFEALRPLPVPAPG